jgi:hypothetical protein
MLCDAIAHANTHFFPVVDGAVVKVISNSDEYLEGRDQREEQGCVGLQERNAVREVLPLRDACPQRKKEGSAEGFRIGRSR